LEIEDPAYPGCGIFNQKAAILGEFSMEPGDWILKRSTV